MANYLQVSMQQTILELKKKGWSDRRVARELGVNRRTVRRYSAPPDSKRAISTTGSGPPDQGLPDSKRAISTTGSSGRKSLCQDYHQRIANGLESGLTAQRIYQDLCFELDFAGSYESVKRYVRKLAATLDPPFRRMESEAGVEAQVDYGTGAWIIQKNGKRKKTHLFRIVLSHSRKGYCEVSFSQDTENFLRSLENAFRHFGGVPATIVIDNLKAGVIKPCVYDPELNPKLREFAAHYGTCILPTKVGTPRHKGKVEKSVDYVQNNALKGKKFHSIREQNEFLSSWEERIADKRVHGTVRKQILRMFVDEKPYLQKLPDTLFPVFHESRRKVHRDGHIEVAKSFYSVPPEYLRREVWARYDLRTVSVYNHRMEKIAMHARVEPGKFSTHQYHVPEEKISNIEKGNAWLLRQADRIGGESGAWARAMLKDRGVCGLRVLNGLLQLTDKYTSSAINQACGEAIEQHSFRLRELKELINQTYKMEQLKFDFLDEHPLIRDLSEYEIINNKEVFPCNANWWTN